VWCGVGVGERDGASGKEKQNTDTCNVVFDRERARERTRDCETERVISNYIE